LVVFDVVDISVTLEEAADEDTHGEDMFTPGWSTSRIANNLYPIQKKKSFVCFSLFYFVVQYRRDYNVQVDQYATKFSKCLHSPIINVCIYYGVSSLVWWFVCYYDDAPMKREKTTEEHLIL
jgi:hypothetical protein